MADERPNVTVVYQTTPAAGPGLGAVLLELFCFLIMVGLVALFAGGGCALLL